MTEVPTQGPAPRYRSALPPPEFRDALGALIARASYLDDQLKYWVKNLAGWDQERVENELGRRHAGQLRTLISDLAKRRFPDNDILEKFEAVLEACELLSEARNLLLHGLYLAEVDVEEEVVLLAYRGLIGPLPKPTFLWDLARKMDEAQAHMSVARKTGWFAQAREMYPEPVPLKGKRRGE